MPKEFDKFYMQNCPHNECFTNITVKYESFTVGELKKAQKKFEKVSYIFTDKEDEN